MPSSFYTPVGWVEEVTPILPGLADMDVGIEDAHERIDTHVAAADPHPGYALDSDLGLYLPKSLVDAKGDLLVASADDTVGRLAVGANGKVLKANSAASLGVEWADETGGGSGITRVTSLPGSPTDGQIVAWNGDAGAGVGGIFYWLLRYESSSGKWWFLGGTPLLTQITTRQTVNSTSYTDLATAGPSITAPAAGSYEIVIAADIDANGGNSGSTFSMSYAIGGTAAVDADRIFHVNQDNLASGPQFNYHYLGIRIKTLAVSTALVSKYKASSVSMGAFAERLMRVTPIWVSA